MASETSVYRYFSKPGTDVSEVRRHGSHVVMQKRLPDTTVTVPVPDRARGLRYRKIVPGPWLGWRPITPSRHLEQ